MHHHHHTVEMRKVGDQMVLYLNGTPLLADTRVEALLPDGHKQHGCVLLDTTCCKNESKPFITIRYHGVSPWIYLVGMKVARL